MFNFYINFLQFISPTGNLGWSVNPNFLGVTVLQLTNYLWNQLVIQGINDKVSFEQKQEILSVLLKAING